MKKFLALILASVLVFSLAACGEDEYEVGSEEHKEALQNNMDNLDNYTITVSIEDPNNGTLSETHKIDGDKALAYQFEVYYYYQLLENDEALFLSPIEDLAEKSGYYGDTISVALLNMQIDHAFIFRDFDYSEFDYGEGEFVITDYEDFGVVTFTVDGDYLSTVEYSVTYGDITFPISIRFFNINSTELNMPTYVTVESLAELATEINDTNSTHALDINIFQDPNNHNTETRGFEYRTLDTTYYFIFGEDTIRFNEINDTFYPETFEIEADGTTYSVEDYLATTGAVGDLDLYNKLLELYRIFVTE